MFFHIFVFGNLKFLNYSSYFGKPSFHWKYVRKAKNYEKCERFGKYIKLIIIIDNINIKFVYTLNEI